MNDNDKIQGNLQTALDQLLAALVLSGGDLGDEVPADAIDAALAKDPAVQTTRQAVLEALRALQGAAARNDPRQAAVAAEEAVNALVARSADAAYRVGLRVGRGLRS